MHRIGWLFMLALVLSSALSASNIGDAQPCAAGTLEDYIALQSTGCSIGSIVLRDFSFDVISASGEPVVAGPEDVFVVPVPGAGVYGLTYSSPEFAVTAGQSVSYLLNYTIDPSPPIIRGLNLRLSTESPVAPGVASISEQACVGAAFSDDVCPTGTPMSLNVFDNGVTSTLDAFLEFAPVSVVGITATISLDASQGGSADFQNFTGSATVVPEPSSGVMAIGGLLFLLSAITLKTLRN